MLLIRGIKEKLEGYDRAVPVLFLKLNRYGMFGTFGGEVHLTIYDTNTGTDVTLLFRTMSSISDWLMIYKPYGYIDMHGIGYSYVVVIDEVSFKFLDCIDSVERLPLSPDKEFKPSPEFESLDENMSIFACHNVGGSEAICTIFQAIAYSSEHMSNGEAYISGWPDLLEADQIDTFTGSGECMYRVTFSNYRLAARLVSKAVTLNKNPLKSLIESSLMG